MARTSPFFFKKDKWGETNLYGKQSEFLRCFPLSHFQNASSLVLAEVITLNSLKKKNTKKPNPHPKKQTKNLVNSTVSYKEYVS